MSSFTLLYKEWIFYGLLASFLGFIAGVISIFIHTRYEMSRKSLVISYAGLIFCSIPVLYLMFIIFFYRNA